MLVTVAFGSVSKQRNDPVALAPFHLAIRVHDLASARRFYGGVLGCPEGRSAPQWVDFDLLGHQLVCHLDPSMLAHVEAAHHNYVDTQDVPVPHFGVVLSMPDWQVLARRLTDAGANFVIEPGIRFAGQPGEQATLSMLDPSGNALEFKALGNPANLFAS